MSAQTRVCDPDRSTSDIINEHDRRFPYTPFEVALLGSELISFFFSSFILIVGVADFLCLDIFLVSLCIYKRRCELMIVVSKVGCDELE